MSPSRESHTDTAGVEAAIAAFWRWWPRARVRAEAAIGGGGWGDLPTEFGERVTAINSDLQWELAKGRQARHALVVSPGGRPELRAPAARWLDGAPPADATWEYHAARQPDPDVLDSTMRIHDADIALAALRFGFLVDPDRNQVDLTVYHPAFPDLPEQVRVQISFLSLDWLLGEDGVERWVGPVEIGAAPPADAQPAGQLKAAVDRLATEADEDVWVLLSGKDGEGWPVMACARPPLVPVRFPRFDTHLAVTLTYRVANDGGLPVDGSLQALRRIEDRLTDALAGTGTLLAHETGHGVRTLHYYVDPTTDAAERIRTRLPEWREGPADLAQSYDPGLRHVRHLSP